MLRLASIPVTWVHVVVCPSPVAQAINLTHLISEQVDASNGVVHLVFFVEKTLPISTFQRVVC